MKSFIIAYMYPDLMNLYADRGNIICLQKRMQWYGFPCKVQAVHIGAALSFDEVDMVFMGGGSDRELKSVYQDLASRADDIKQAVEDHLPVLCICNAYQLLGREYETAEGMQPGLNLGDFYTIAAEERMVGNIVLESSITGQKQFIVGFENHAGKTFLTDKERAFARVIKGYGNNGEDGTEGIHYKNLVGTHLLGPLLPKNPHIADFFIKTMVQRRGIDEDWQHSLDDTMEWLAHEQIKSRILKVR